MLALVRNLKVAHRLALGFGLMSAVLAVTCGVSAWNSERVKRLSRTELSTAQADYVAAVACKLRCCARTWRSAMSG
jgi:CHASE3 domain sensor protein